MAQGPSPPDALWVPATSEWVVKLGVDILLPYITDMYNAHSLSFMFHTSARIVQLV